MEFCSVGLVGWLALLGEPSNCTAPPMPRRPRCPKTPRRAPSTMGSVPRPLFRVIGGGNHAFSLFSLVFSSFFPILPSSLRICCLLQVSKCRRRRPRSHLHNTRRLSDGDANQVNPQHPTSIDQSLVFSSSHTIRTVASLCPSVSFSVLDRSGIPISLTSLDF